MARAALAAYRQEARQTQIDALPRTDVLLCLFRYETHTIAGDSGQDDVVESVAEFPDEGGRRAPLLDHWHLPASCYAASPKKPKPKRFFSPIPAYQARRRSSGEPHKVNGKVMPTTTADWDPIRLISTLVAQLCRRVATYIS